MKLGELASRLGAELRGDAELEVTGVKGIEEAGPTEVTFVANPKYTALARTTKAAAVLVEPDFQEISAATLASRIPIWLFPGHWDFSTSPRPMRRAFIPRRSSILLRRLAEGAHIGAYVVIGPDVRSGSPATLLPHVVLYPGVQAGSHLFAHAHAVVRENCILGDHVTLENGAIVGADGFGFAKNEAGHWEKIPQSGPVRLGNRVDVQANACIDRATVGATEIGDGTKVDNLVQIGHGSRVGKTRCFARRQVWPVRRWLATTSFWRGKRALPAIARGRRRHSDRAIGGLARCAGRQDDLRLAGLRQPLWLRAVTIFQRLPELLKRLDRLEKKTGAPRIPL